MLFPLNVYGLLLFGSYPRGEAGSLNPLPLSHWPYTFSLSLDPYTISVRPSCDLPFQRLPLNWTIHEKRENRGCLLTAVNMTNDVRGMNFTLGVSLAGSLHDTGQCYSRRPDHAQILYYGQTKPIRTDKFPRQCRHGQTNQHLQFGMAPTTFTSMRCHAW